MTRHRLQQLVAAITHNDDADRRLARHDLDLIENAHCWAEVAISPDDPAFEAWRQERVACP